MTGQQNKDDQDRCNLNDQQIQSNQEIGLSGKIKEELAHIHFSSQEEVLRQTHPQKMTDRLRYIWHKELEIPVAPLLTVSACILLIGIGVSILPVDDLAFTGALKEHRELVDTGAGIYWSDFLEKAVSSK